MHPAICNLAIWALLLSKTALPPIRCIFSLCTVAQYSNQTLAVIGAAAVQDCAATRLPVFSASDSRQTLGHNHVYSVQD